MDREVVLRIKDIYKNFGATVALNHVSFEVKKGEIRGLIGENGSGKSTVSSIIAGIQQAASGEMIFKGKTYKPTSVLEATKSGIAMIVQEAGTIANITVAENIFLGHERIFASGIFINRHKMIKAADELLDRLDIKDIRGYMRINELDMQARKMVEIAKAMYWDPSLVIIDETTTIFSQNGKQFVYDLMKQIASNGNSVLIISHDLEELMTHCDTLTILRDGQIIGNLTKEEYDGDNIKKMMVGREIKGDYYRSDQNGYSDEVVLKADCITTLKELLCFNLSLHKGEILGIGGLADCGMHTLGKALFGAEEILDGKIIAGREKNVIRNPLEAIECGIGYISKDRDKDSLGLSASISDNIASTGYRINQLFGPLISGRKEKQYVKTQISNLSLKCASPYHAVSTLSGGNKQKVVFGKWIGGNSQILILDCPTRGIDIGVKAAMYKLIYEMKMEGRSIILISEELPELIGMSDRVLIMKKGKVVHEAMRSENLSENEIIMHMI